jgi:hypothetical protein
MKTKVWRTGASIFTFQHRYFICNSRLMITTVAALLTVLQNTCLLLPRKRLMYGNVHGFETSLRI